VIDGDRPTADRTHNHLETGAQIELPVMGRIAAAERFPAQP
jgi:hypothetical protein